MRPTREGAPVCGDVEHYCIVWRMVDSTLRANGGFQLHKSPAGNDLQEDNTLWVDSYG